MKMNIPIASVLLFVVSAITFARSSEAEKFTPPPQVAVVGPTINASSTAPIKKNQTTIILKGIAKFTVPAGALPAGQKIIMAAKSDVDGASRFDSAALDNDVSRRMRHYITISIGDALVAGKVLIEIETTPEFRAALKPGETIRAFGIFDDGDTQSFEPFDTTISADKERAIATLDKGAFALYPDGSKQATLVLAAIHRPNNR